MALLARTREIELIGEAQDGQTAVDLTRETSPDVELVGQTYFSHSISSPPSGNGAETNNA
ncbi:MAG: hypothetical protein M1482_06420 [Chloroflexi bacterium]|nr:hypothetical protein [Chloroflexota bacterium]